MDHYKEAWSLIKPNLVSWVIFGVVLGLVFSVTGGLGVVIYPNAMRATRDALKADRAPELGDLFKFDHLSDDLMAMIVYFAAAAIGGVVLVGTLITMPLVWWVPMLAADGRFAGVEAAKASFAHVKANFMPVFGFFILTIVVNSLGTMTCFIGTLITVPLTLVASWRHYEQMAQAIIAAGIAGGATPKA